MNDSRHPAHPLVSIILPTYKRAALLGQAMESILEQTYSNFELIIVDDNSPDDTTDVVSRFDDPRIHYHRNDVNLKLPRNLNKGFSLSLGEYLTWTSDDNLLHPQAIEKMVEAIGSHDCDFVYADYYQFSDLDTEGRPIDPQIAKLPDTLQLEKGNHIGACFLYSRKLYQKIGDYDPELFLVEDYDYFIRAAREFRFHHLPEALYYFRRDDNTLYYSRFSEVKASDMLIRFRNELIDETGVIRTMVALLMSRIDYLNSKAIVSAQRLLKPLSFRLHQLFLSQLERHFERRLRPSTTRTLQAFRAGTLNFAQARDELKTAMENLGLVARH